MAEVKKCKPLFSKWSRGTQAIAADIDLAFARRSDLLNMLVEDKPIHAIGNTPIVPQCRFCLRRASPENLKIILREDSTRAQAAFQIRVFHFDAYPYACSNCLNMVDIILDYKIAVTKAHNLLLDKRLYLESDGWDEPMNIECFKQCKSAIEEHRLHIDEIYDKLMVREGKRNSSTLQPKIESDIEPATVETTNDVNHSSENEMDIEATVEYLYDSDVNEIEHPLLVDNGSTDAENAMVSQQVLELPSEIADNTEIHIVTSESTHVITPTKMRKAKEKKIHYSSESEQDPDDKNYELDVLYQSEDEDEDPDYKPETIDLKHDEFIKKEFDDGEDPDYEPETNILKHENSVKAECEPENSEIVVSKRKKSRKKRTTMIKENKPKKTKRTNRPPQKVQLVLCDLCGESVYPETIEGHRNRHLGIKPYNCPADGCDWTFYGRANMQTHVRRVHPQNGVQSLECDVCGKFIKGTHGKLNVHRNLHFRKERNFVCPLCGKGFTKNRYLKQHSITHTGLFPHECSYCGKKFNNKWSMKTHEKNIHEKRSQMASS
ncbi:AAEL010323-PA [Aedes aegypti]|uniref:C2H2-type domain-containing protein n=2 Tax=Aedes aegypti TaxID=7159 RepID=Q0IEH4_AEDAE|nr:gastrula zinc finger protein XlCGF48.2 [Aedes aegypti]XP_021704281.1 gastrula zinc finger protein XlCGF48.2 [Aedes aegypti]EAT37737.1 AAEL010323-PA [Aedes aegypti]